MLHGADLLSIDRHNVYLFNCQGVKLFVREAGVHAVQCYMSNYES